MMVPWRCRADVAAPPLTSRYSPPDVRARKSGQSSATAVPFPVPQQLVERAFSERRVF